MKRILSAAAASMLTLFAVSGSFSAYAATEKDVSALELSAVLKQTEFTYNGGMICPEYKLSGQSDWKNDTYATSDYKISYRYNVNAGTGQLIAAGQGAYTGEQTLATFTIKPLDVKDIEELSVGIGAAEYTGKPTLPFMEIYSGSRELKESVDYTVSSSDNIELGIVKGTVNFRGNYTGSYPIAFRIVHAPVNRFRASTSSDGIKLTWDKVECDEANIFRTEKSTGKTEKIGTTSGNEYTDTTARQLTEYSYTVQTVKTYNGIRYSANSTARSITAPLAAPKLEAVIQNGAAALSWTSNPEAEGYMLYIDGKFYKDLRGAVTSYTVSGISDPADHKFTVSAYARINGVMTFSAESGAADRPEINVPNKVEETSILRNAKKTDSRSFTIHNVQGETTSAAGTVTLSDSDIATLDKFAKEHFTDNMTDYEKLRVTLEWINRNNNYAYTAADWNRIAGCSYVDAIFNKKTGQCAQYNGAMVSMIVYLGYEADLILGWRGSWPGSYWQHYWGEMTIGGTKYVIEAGNYGKSGTWSYLLAPYGYASRYIVNHKNM